MGGFAWVTLATNDSYSLGALVLAHSLRRAGTKHDLAVLITPGVTQVMRDKLAAVFSLVQEVNVLDSKDEANLALLARPELGITFTKLHCWRLTQYEKCVFVDADALVIRNCDELFECEELSAAPDVGWPDCFNSGVFVFTPSQQTFASITSFAAEKGSFDGGDQGLLNSYFSDWAHKDIAKHLPFIYNMCSTATYSYLPAYKQYGENARIIHFIGATKPWLQYFDTETGVVHPPSGCNHLQPLLQLWWNIFCENVHSQLSSVMAWSTLAPIWQRFTPSLPGDSAPSYPIYDDSSHDHKYRSSIPQSDEERYEDDDYTNEPADFSEFNDPWEEYIPRNTQMENVVYYHQEYIKEQYYVDEKNDDYSQKTNYYESYNHVDEKSNVFQEKRYRDENENENRNKKTDIVYQDFTHRSEDTVSKIIHHREESRSSHVDNREYLEQSRLGNNFETFNVQVEKNETKYFQNENVEEINERLHGESVRDDGQNDVDKPPPSWDHGPNNNDDTVIAQHYIPISHSHEPCTDPSHNVAQHNEQSIDSQGNLDKNEDEDAGIAGALAQLTLGEPRSSQQSALEEHMRRQGWEQGHIDYMGQDSFDNIWKKICTTLDKAPQRQPSPPKEVESVESKPSALPEPSPVVESSTPAATETEDNVVSPIPSEDQATTIQEPTEAIQPPIPETIQTPTAEEEEQQITKLDSIEQEAKPIVEVEKPEEKVSSLPEPETLDDAPAAEKFISTFEVAAAPQAAEEPLAPVKLSTILSSTPIPVSEPEAEGIDVASELSELILDSSSVPIQVAESVLQSEPKESASEEQGPIGEEAVSSVVAPVLESATAVSETVSEPKEREPATPNTQNITNGVEKTSPGSQAPPKTEETPAPEPVADKPEPEPVVVKPAPEPVADKPEPVAEKPTPEPVADKPEPEPVVEKPAPEPVVEKPAPEPVVEKPAPEPVADKPEPDLVVEKPAPEPVVEKSEPEPVAEKPEPEPVVEKPAPEPVVEKPEPEPVVEKLEPEPVAEKVPEDVTDEVQVEEESLNGDSSKSASVTPPDSPITECPVPVRPARTRDPKIPTTPTVTEATPPNSPPIGAGQSLEDAPKTVKKIVKKVVKKVPTEGEGSEAAEGETTGKKVVKKIVKKIVKKPKEGEDADGAEASGAAEKPKKVVKIVKKIVKPSDSLEVDTSVPETPPVGVPVPPKRKIKTTTTTTTKVTTTTKTPSADGGKPSESEP